MKQFQRTAIATGAAQFVLMASGAMFAHAAQAADAARKDDATTARLDAHAATMKLTRIPSRIASFGRSATSDAENPAEAVATATSTELAIASPERNPQAKNIPTLREQGVSNADADSWAAFFAPAKTPQPVLDVLSKAIIASLNKPATRDAIIKLGFTLKVRDPEAFRPYHLQEIATWKQIIADAGVKAE